MAHDSPSINADPHSADARGPIGQAVTHVLDLLLPPQCLNCGCIVETTGALCAPCWEQVSFLTSPFCACCGLPFEEDAGTDALCGACHRARPAYQRARAVMIYDEASRHMILAYKHGDRTDMAPASAAWAARAGGDLIADADLIAPVPLHWTRLFRWRFNQAALIARHLSADGGQKFAPDLIVRKRRTPSQAGLGFGGRRRNVRGAFRAAAKWRSRLAGKRVLLIDDVMTTGATVSSCARVLTRDGASAVDVLTLARVVPASAGVTSSRSGAGQKGALSHMCRWLMCVPSVDEKEEFHG